MIVPRTDARITSTPTRMPPAAPRSKPKRIYHFQNSAPAIQTADVRRMLRDGEKRGTIEQEQELHLCKD
jgi:hypothetical protein